MRIGGLASGMDIDKIVKDLMKAERMPMDKMFQRKQTIEWQRDEYRSVNLALSKFRNEFSNMRLQGTFNAYSVSSSNTAVATATTNGSTTSGSFDLTVTNLAESAKVTSATSLGVKSTDKVLAANETQEFWIENGAGLRAKIAIDDTDTYLTLARKIGGAKDDTTGVTLGLSANFDDTTGRFFITTRELGAAQSIKFEENADNFVKTKILGDTSLTGPDYIYTGVNGQITYNGINVNNLTSNNVTINGVNMSLVKTGTTTLTVKSDVDAVVKQIKGFVDSYNKIIDDLEAKLTQPKFRDFPPLTKEQREAISDKEAELWDEKSKSGLLRNDSLVRETITTLRRAMMDTVQGIAGGEINSLAQIGINTGEYKMGGRLFVDENKLKEALTNKPEQVINLFTKVADTAGNHSEMGIGRRMNEKLVGLLDKYRARAGVPGMTVADSSVLGKGISRLNTDITNWERKLSRIENRYWKQFSAMEKGIDRLNQQSMSLIQGMAGG